MATHITLPYWYDLHVHLRQDALIAPLVAAHKAMGCAGVLAMPNTRPPVASIGAINSYRDDIEQAGGGDFQAIIIPLYLTRETTPSMIEEGARSGILKACKYYPPHGTTNSDFGAPLDEFIENGVFAAMEAHGVVLCIHGEAHDLDTGRYFSRTENAEEVFYRERLPRVVEAFPQLRIVCEHITTKVAAAFVNQAPAHIGATITPQHLLYTVGDLLTGLNYHLYCKPVLKFTDDIDALRAAVSAPEQTKFFAGTDSAPHTHKCTPCGCAAGCFTGGVAPQLYAMGLETGGIDLDSQNGQEIFKRFLCDNGRHFYDLPEAKQSFTLIRESAPVTSLETPDGPIIPLPVGLNADHAAKGTALPWRLLV